MSAIIQTPVQVIGNAGHSGFYYDGTSSGKVLTKIAVWAGGWFLGAIRVWFTDEEPKTYGTTLSGSYKEFTFADGELITSLSLWGNGAGTRSGGIRIRTSRSREFYHHMTSWGLKQEYPVDVASGICVGITGMHGWHVDCVGFMFLRPIASARMIDLRYPTLDLGTAGIVPIMLDAYTDSNNTGSLAKTWRFHGSREVTVSSSWSVTSGIALHATVTVQAGIPGVVQVGGEYGWEVSVAGTYGTSHQNTRTLGWDQSGVLEPGQWISLTATTREGTINVPYEATMEITLRTGAIFRYRLRGQYAGVSYTRVDITTVGTRSDSAGEAAAQPPEESAAADAPSEPKEWVQELRESNLGF